MIRGIRGKKVADAKLALVKRNASKQMRRGYLNELRDSIQLGVY